MLIILQQYIFTYLQSSSNSNMPLMCVALSPMHKQGYAIAPHRGVSLWLQLHLHFRCDVVNFRHIVDVVVGWLASDLVDLIIFGVSHTHPSHGVFDSLKLGDVSDVKVDDSGWLVDRQLVSASLQIVLKVEKIEHSPAIGLEHIRVYLLIIVFFFLLIPKLIGVLPILLQVTIAREQVASVRCILC